MITDKEAPLAVRSPYAPITDAPRPACVTRNATVRFTRRMSTEVLAQRRSFAPIPIHVQEPISQERYNTNDKNSREAGNSHRIFR